MPKFVFQYDVLPAVDKQRAGTYHGLEIEADNQYEAHSKTIEYLEQEWGSHSLISNIKPDTQPPTE